jgi:hypothetical protein
MKRVAKNTNYFWFGVSLILSILVVVWGFETADKFRGYNSVGSEIFLIILPLWIVWHKLEQLEQKIKRMRRINKAYLRKIL